jgi:hypothetical protein
MEVQDCNDLISCILVAVTDIKGNQNYWFMLGTPFNTGVLHAIRAEGGNFEKICEEIHRIACKSPLHDPTFVFNTM